MRAQAAKGPKAAVRLHCLLRPETKLMSEKSPQAIFPIN